MRACGEDVTPDMMSKILREELERIGVDPENPAFNAGGREKFKEYIQ